MTDTTTIYNQPTVNTTDIRFGLGRILTELERRKTPILVISRSKPKAWLYPYETAANSRDLFLQWQNNVLPKYKKIKAKDMIKIIRQDRERR